MDPQWIVVMTKPRQEDRAATHLIEQNFTCYVPKVAKKDKLGRVSGLEPMFPGYCFCGFLANQSIASLRSTPGVLHPVKFGTQIARLRQVEIARFKAAEAYLAATTANSAVKPNDRVKIISGPLVGFEGLASRVRQHRIDVLMVIMGQMQRLKFEQGQVALQ